MTENESEHLYEELRRRLADYGSAPPEAVWESIRQQVPARKRWNWRRGVVLLAVLCLPLLFLTLFSPQWRQWTGLGLSPTQPAVVPAAPNAATTTQAAVSDSSAPAGTVAAGATSARSGLANASSVSTPLATPSTSPPARTIKKNQDLVAGSLGHSAAQKAHGQLSRATLAPTGQAKLRRVGRQELAAALLLARQPERNALALGQQVGSSQDEAQAQTQAGEPLGDERQLRIGSNFGIKASLAAAPNTGAAATENANNDLAYRFSNTPLSLLVVRPALPVTAEPRVDKVILPSTPRSRKAQLLAGWSVQMVAGPSLTYRKIDRDSARQLERLERPGIGYSGQIMASYALTPRLTVSTGLGYMEYANNLRYKLQKTSQEANLQVDFRDVYRFVSIPLLSQYTLGGNQRWRFGMLGGANLGLLTSTRTTEGSACNCSQTTTPAAGTYRNTSLALTAGGFLNYQFAPGKWLTISPQGQYFLNSLTDPTIGRAARHPWSVGMQGGISFDLSSKK